MLLKTMQVLIMLKFFNTGLQRKDTESAIKSKSRNNYQ